MRLRYGVLKLLAITISSLFLGGIVLGQDISPAEQEAYQAAVSKPVGPEQVNALAQFAAAHPGSRLKIDALELLVWNARRSGGMADLEYWTGQLLSVAPENPLAAAVIVGDRLNIGGEGRVSLAKRALPAIESFDRPDGLSHEEFTAMRNFVTVSLNGVVGYSYFENKNFAAARPYLRKAVATEPQNAQYTYTLALSDLQGTNPDQAEGFAMLARSVNLAKGTPAGERLAEYARQNFERAGGTSENWDKYLAATAVPQNVPSQENATVAGVASVGASAKGPAAVSSGLGKREPILVASNNVAPPIPGGTSAALAREPAPDRRPLRVFPPRPIRHFAPGSPVSLGVLIQASLAAKANRHPIVYTLSDFVRHLRGQDEAFIMSFSRGMVFQEDLTSNNKLLEEAMDSIAPTPGAAIYDAVTFAAGHLDRVARNKNRVLLVIAAEGDRDSTVSPLELSSEIDLSGVTIYCIGVGLTKPEDESRLEALADSTGGRAIFIPDLSGFRNATHTIADGLGIAFPN